MRLLSEFADKLPAELNAALHAEATPEDRREQVAALRQALAGVAGAEELLTDADALVEKSVWLIGGDGWAYDIGFGGFGPCTEPDGKRQYSGAGHSVLLQHRRAGVKKPPRWEQ